MRVIFVNRYFHPDHSATAQMLTDLACGLAARGHEVLVLAGDQRIDESPPRLARLADVRGVQVRRVAGPRLGRGRLVRRALDAIGLHAGLALALARAARAGDVIVALTDPPMLSVTAMAVARARGVAQVNWIHDLFPEIAMRLGVAGLRGPAGAFLLVLRNWSLRGARCNVAIGQSMARHVRGLVGGAGIVRVVHNWADGAAVAPIERDGHSLRERWGVRDRFVVMYSGNFGRVHTFDGVLDAARRLAGDERVRFVLIGSGARRGALEEQVSRERLVNVQFLDHQPREMLGHTLTAADAHLVSLDPALEGLVVPSKIYGALAAGRPVLVIGEEHGEMAQIVRSAGCGSTLAPGDGAGLARAVGALVDEPLRAARLGSAARSAFEACFDFPGALDAWEALLHDVARAARH